MPEVKVETRSESQNEATFCLTVVTMRDWNDGELCWIVLVVFIVGVAAPENPQVVLVRRLFMGYERLPPPYGPTAVSLGIYINYFFAISEQSMDYRLSFYLRQSWIDSRLQFNKALNLNNSKLKLMDSQIKDVWIPDIFFRNEKGASFHIITQPNRLFYIFDDGKVWYVSKITATFSCPMKLQKYPFDTQACPLQFESFGYNTDTVVFKWFEHIEPVQFDDTGKELPEMVVDRVELDNCSKPDPSSSSGKFIPCLEVKFVVTRPLGYFMIQFYVASVLLVMLSWVSSWISVDAVVARVNIGLMSVLNLVTMSTGSRNQLPKVSYVKAIDVWMTTCLVFAFASLIEFAIVNVWSRMEAKEKKTDGAPAAVPAPASEKKMTKKKTKDASIEIIPQQVNQLTPEPPGSPAEPSTTGSDAPGSPPPTPAAKGSNRLLRRRLSNVSDIVTQKFSIHQHRAKRLDRLSRIFFPVSFLVFTGIYWMAYTL